MKRENASVAPLVPPHVAAVQPYVPGKQPAELERELGIKEAVKLASNENPLGASPAVAEAITRAATGTHRYSDDAAYDLHQQLAAHHRVTPGEIALGHGSNELIDLVVRTFTTPADHAIIGAPSFACYGIALRAANIPLTTVPLRDALYWDVPALLAAVQPSTKLLFLDNPNNPTSTHVPGGELETLLRELPEQVVVMIDEAYFEYVTATDYVSALSLRNLHERLLVLRTFSKAYGLASLRVGYAVAPAELVSFIERVRIPFNVNGMAQTAALAALGDPAHVARVVVHNTAERARVSQALAAMGLHVAPSQTNFVCVNVARPAREVYDKLLRHGVMVRPFGPPLDKHLRVSIGSVRENDAFLAALPKVLAG